MNCIATTAPLFVSVIETGSFTQAAKVLGVSKSYLSEQIKLLEEQANITLLLRTTRNLSPTDAGRIYYEQSKKYLQWRAETEELLVGNAESIKGQLNVTSVQAFAEFQLHDVIKRYTEQYPNINIKLIANNQKSNLLSEDYDVAIRLTETPPNHLVAKKLMDVRYVCCTSPKYFQNRNRPTHPTELKDHNCAITPETQYWTFKKKKEEIKQVVSGSVVTSSNHLFRKLALDGSHIVRIPSYVISHELTEGLLVPILTDWIADTRPLYYIYPKQKETPLKLKKFFQYLTEHVKKLNQAIAPDKSI